MADLALYENFLEHARLSESLLNRQRSARLRNLELSFDVPDAEFIGLYRLNKSVCLELIREIEPFLPNQRSGISITSKVLASLSFYASGSYQRVIGASAHNKMHQVSVSNCMRAVTKALNEDYFRAKYIRFPQSREERNIVQHGFYQKFGIPGVLGCIDGTHISIVKPADYEERYFNRKRYHSLNAQIVCDSNLNILSFDASHGGASHDSFVWNHHPLKAHLEYLQSNNNETVYFLGDSGYPLRPTVMTPIIDTQAGTAQRYYTELHCRARNTVERCIGVLKSRWRCLLIDRKLHYHSTTAGLIANACVVLHNMANAARLPVESLPPHEEQVESAMQIPHTSAISNNFVAGERARNALIQRICLTR